MGGFFGILNMLFVIVEIGDEVIVIDLIYVGLLNCVCFVGGVFW